MHDESHFLAEIDASPDDRAVRLVYADWLEDQGDPRADLVRVEEEMRALPIFSDRYWALKPRRNELREAGAEAWLARMYYGTDYEPVFREVPDGWRERWRLLRELTERWHGVAMADVGRHGEAVQSVEGKLKRKLPPSVREWVAYCTDLDPAVCWPLRDSYTMEHLEGHDAVSLMIQAEGDVHWAVRSEALGNDDPPVDEYYLDYEALDYEEGGRRFVHHHQCAPRVTSWVFRRLSHFLHGAGGGFGVRVSPTPEFLRQLADAFPVRAELDGLFIFEKRNWIVVLAEDWLEENRFKPIPPSQVPAFLRKLQQRGSWSSGDPQPDDIPF
jgi:uncharacterized protein (TIGR02996 family)